MVPEITSGCLTLQLREPQHVMPILRAYAERGDTVLPEVGLVKVQDLVMDRSEGQPAVCRVYWTRVALEKVDIDGDQVDEIDLWQPNPEARLGQVAFVTPRIRFGCELQYDHARRHPAIAVQMAVEGQEWVACDELKGESQEEVERDANRAIRQLVGDIVRNVFGKARPVSWGGGRNA